MMYCYVSVTIKISWILWLGKKYNHPKYILQYLWQVMKKCY